MSTTDRDAWLAARGRPDAQWFACEMCPDFPYGQGDLAEVMGYMLVPTGREYFRSQVAPAPTDAQMLLLRQLTRLDEQQRAL